MRKKIGIDFTYILKDDVTGIRKYGEEIAEGLSKMGKDYEIVLFVNEQLKNAFEKNFPQYKVVVEKFYLKNVRFIRRINTLGVVKKLKSQKIKKENCDLIIYLYVNKYVSIIEDVKKIITIHDIIPLDEIKDKNSFMYKKIKKENADLMNKTDTIVTISEYSKKRLEEINPEYKGKIFVIPNSVAKLKETDKDVVDIIEEDVPYIFSINSFFKHKNQMTLVKAFERIKDKIPHKLVLVGRPEIASPISAYKDVMNYIESHNLKDIVEVFSDISDEDRNTLFYNADLFVTTSMQEGFGRTPVEAGLCKVPVISTKETSLPEATMGMAFYYDNPTDDKELADKIMEVLGNRPSKERLEEIANKLENTYSIETVSKDYIKVIDNVLKN